MAQNKKNRSKSDKKPGRAPSSVRIEGAWEEAVGRALQKNPPPKPKSKSSKK